MAGTERDGPNGGESGLADHTDVEPDDTDDGSGGLLGRVRGALGVGDQEDIDEPAGPRAELVDGATVLFLDPAAASKPLHEYDLVLITAPEYPEPVVLRNRAPIEIPEGSVLCTAESSTMLQLGEKRVIVRSNILVPPERADEVSPDYRRDVPDEVVGKTIPERPVQDPEFFKLIVNAVAAGE